MTAHHKEFQKALNAALSCQKLYGRAHAATLRAVAGAAELLRKADDQRGLLVHAVGGQVVGREGPIGPVAETAADIFAALARHHLNSLHVLPGATDADLAAFLEQLALGSAPAHSDHARIVCGTSGAQQQSAERDTVATTSGEAALTFRGIWEGIPARGEVDATPVHGVVDHLLEAVAASRGALLELASVKEHDQYTFIHTVNVGLLAAALGEACGLGGETLRGVMMAALMHDVGKRRTPLNVLNKSAKLSDAERHVMQRHPVDGAAILIGQKSIPAVCAVVAFEHHMHLDGSGYPTPPRRWRPHLASQIVQLADVYDALRTHRPYRPSMAADKVLAILREGAGTKYDPALVDTFATSVAPRSGRSAA